MVGRMSSSCARCGAVASAGARFCAACGAPLEAPGGPERKLATLVFADLVGSTALVSERDPEDARRLLEPFFEVARTVLEQHGGPGREVHRRRRGRRLRRPPRPRRRPRPRGRRRDRAGRPARRRRRGARAAGRDRVGRGARRAREAATSRSPASRRTRRRGCSRPPRPARSWSASAPPAPAGRPALDGPHAVSAKGFAGAAARLAGARARRLDPRGDPVPRPRRRARDRCGSPTCGRSASASRGWS